MRVLHFAFPCLLACVPFVSSCSSDGSQPPVPGKRVLEGANLSVLGTTSDDAIVYEDGASGELKAVDAGGSVIGTIAATGGSYRISIDGPVVFAWTNVSEDANGVAVNGALTVWTKSAGASSKAPSSYPQTAAASTDGQSILYTVIAGGTTSVVADAVTGGTPRTLVAAVSTQGFCGKGATLYVAPETKTAVVSACPPNATTFTVQSAPAGAAAATLATDTAAPYVRINPSGTRLLYLQLAAGGTDGTLRSVPLAGGNAVDVDTAVVDGEWIPTVDFSKVVYHSGGALKSASPNGGSVATVVPNGVQYLAAVAPAGDVALIATKSKPVTGGTLRDAVLAPLGGGNLLTLLADPTACIDCVESPFTSDSKYALFLGPLDVTSGGVLRVASVQGGEASAVGQRVSDAFAVAKGTDATSKVVVDEHSGPALADFDILFFDATKPTAVTRIAARTNTGAWFIEKQTKVTYSYSATADLAGIYVMSVD